MTIDRRLQKVEREVADLKDIIRLLHAQFKGLKKEHTEITLAMLARPANNSDEKPS